MLLRLKFEYISYTVLQPDTYIKHTFYKGKYSFKSHTPFKLYDCPKHCTTGAINGLINSSCALIKSFLFYCIVK